MKVNNIIINYLNKYVTEIICDAGVFSKIR